MWKIETAQLVVDTINKESQTKITLEEVCREMQPINAINPSSYNIFAIQRNNVTTLVKIKFDGLDVNILDVKEIVWE